MKRQFFLIVLLFSSIIIIDKSTGASVISIASDQELITFASANNLQGNGSSGSPFLIRSQELPSVTSISISNTRLHFVISNFTNSFEGISLSNVSNFIISNNGIGFFRFFGLEITNSSFGSILDNILGGDVGIDLSEGRNLTIVSNSIPAMMRGAQFWDLDSSIFANNSLVSDLAFYQGTNNLISANSVTTLWLEGGSYNNVTHNFALAYTFKNSVHNYISSNTVTIPGSNNAFYLLNSNYSSLVGNTISSYDYGIYIEQSIFIELRENIINSSIYGIYLAQINSSEIHSNMIQNSNYGIFLDIINFSVFNSNTIDNSDYGIYDSLSANSSFINNEIIGSHYYDLYVNSNTSRTNYYSGNTFDTRFVSTPEDLVIEQSMPTSINWKIRRGNVRSFESNLKYEIYDNGTKVYSDSLSNDLIYFNLDKLLEGIHNISILIYDSGLFQIFDSVHIQVNHRYTTLFWLDVPQDPFVLTGESLELKWVLSSDRGTNYSIYLDNFEVSRGSWQNTPIVYLFNQPVAKTYNITILVTAQDGVQLTHQTKIKVFKSLNNETLEITGDKFLEFVITSIGSGSGTENNPYVIKDISQLLPSLKNLHIYSTSSYIFFENLILDGYLSIQSSSSIVIIGGSIFGNVTLYKATLIELNGLSILGNMSMYLSSEITLLDLQISGDLILESSSSSSIKGIDVGGEISVSSLTDVSFTPILLYVQATARAEGNNIAIEINWSAFDDNPSYYEILINSESKVSGVWESKINITKTLLLPIISKYHLTLLIYDNSNNILKYTTVVEVDLPISSDIETTPTNIEISSLTKTNPLFYSYFTTFIVLIIMKRRRNKINFSSFSIGS